MRGTGKMKGRVKRQKQTEYFRPADDGDGAIGNAEVFKRLLQRRANRIP